MKKTEWVSCPACGNKARLQLRADTELKNFPLYCPKAVPIYQNGALDG